VVGSGCVSGNCKTGDGVYIHAFEVNFVDQTWADKRVRIELYKGGFSNNGTGFEGKGFMRFVPYLVSRKGTVITYSPTETFNFQDDDLSSFETGEGQMAGSQKSQTANAYNWYG